MRLVPPGGFAGFSQMTPASQSALTKSGANSTGKSRKRMKKSAAAPKRRRRKAKKAAKVYRARKRTSGKKLRKGSPEAKARMAKLRKMRKKK